LSNDPPAVVSPPPTSFGVSVVFLLMYLLRGYAHLVDRGLTELLLRARNPWEVVGQMV